MRQTVPENSFFFKVSKKHDEEGNFPCFIVALFSMNNWLKQYMWEFYPLQDANLLKGHTLSPTQKNSGLS